MTQRAPLVHLRETPAVSWLEPQRQVHVHDNEVHLWKAVVDLDETAIEPFAGLLSRSEGKRAARFKFASDRRRFIARRALLRTLLGHLVGRHPGELQFRTNEHGKPSLTPDQGISGIRFNVSHSGGIAVFAFTLQREIGVDVECVRNVPECVALAERFAIIYLTHGLW